jgi:hypothetical protein
VPGVRQVPGTNGKTVGKCQAQTAGTLASCDYSISPGVRQVPGTNGKTVGKCQAQTAGTRMALYGYRNVFHSKELSPMLLGKCQAQTAHYMDSNQIHGGTCTLLFQRRQRRASAAYCHRFGKHYCRVAPFQMLSYLSWRVPASLETALRGTARQLLLFAIAPISCVSSGSRAVY